MIKIVVAVITLVALATATYLQPRDLADEAQEQLDQLQSIVQGEILAAHDQLESILLNFQTYETNIHATGVIDIQQEQSVIDGQLSSIKDLANSAGKDVSSCTNIREQTLNRLPGRYIDEMLQCIYVIDQEGVEAAQNARYRTDIVINTVHDLQYQLRQCRGEILCISPLLTEINLDKIRLPQRVRTEVQAASALITTLRLSVQSCADHSVSQYTADASTILQDIISCVDRILG